jgi:predicted metal-dependent enzyme (double-stranded beta helix superfamily)
MTTLAIGPDPSPSRPPAPQDGEPPPRGGASVPAGPVAPAVPLPAHMLADIASGFATARPLWSAVVRHDPDGRRPVRLVATERYEVWAIGWTTGQNVRVHDHGDSAGALAVTEGELTEVVPEGGGVIERALAAGQLRDLPLGTIHDVVNRAVEPATSIHVYSPPLTTMTYYDPVTFQAVDTEPVANRPAVLGPGAGAHVLHPSGRAGPWPRPAEAPAARSPVPGP